MSFHFHFCGKKFQYTTLFKAEEKKSCCGEHGATNGCCHDEVVKVDIDDHKQATKLLYSFKQQSPDGHILHAPDSIGINQFYIVVQERSYDLPPPPLLGIKAYIDNCVFLI